VPYWAVLTFPDLDSANKAYSIYRMNSCPVLLFELPFSAQERYAIAAYASDDVHSYVSMQLVGKISDHYLGKIRVMECLQYGKLIKFENMGPDVEEWNLSEAIEEMEDDYVEMLAPDIDFEYDSDEEYFEEVEGE